MEILDTLFAIHILYQITCLSPNLIDRKTCTLKESKPLELYTLCVIAISLSLTLFSLLSEKDFAQTAKRNLAHTMEIILLLGIRVAHLTSICEGLFRKKEQRKFYEEMKQVDRLFECSLNIDTKNKEFHRCTILFGSLMALLYLAAELYLLISNAAFCEVHFLLFWSFHVMPLSVCGLRYFQIFTAIRMLKHRFELLVTVLSQIKLEAPTKEIKDLVPSGDTTEALSCIYPLTLMEAPIFRDRKACEMENAFELKRLLTVRDIYNRLYYLNENLNCNFGLSMLINLGNDFIAITSNCYWIFYNIHDNVADSSVAIGGSSIWSLPHILNVIVLAFLSGNIVKKANKIALSLHRINADIRNDNYNTVIKQFSLQLLHQKISLSAAGIFTIDCTLLYSIVGATTTYLIILIQFHISNTKSDGVHKF